MSVEKNVTGAGIMCYFDNRNNSIDDLENDIYYSIREIKSGEELTCYYLPKERDWNEK